MYGACITVDLYGGERRAVLVKYELEEPSHTILVPTSSSGLPARKIGVSSMVIFGPLCPLLAFGL
jgi:hypothetical protein